MIYGLFAAVVLFESATVDALLDPGTYLYRGIGSWSGLPLIVSPLEVLLAICLAAALLAERPSRDPRPARRSGRLMMPLLLIALGIGLVRGVIDGGDPYTAFWELRALLYVPLAYLAARRVLRSKRHVFVLMQFGLIAMGLFAIEGAYRRLALIDTGQIGVGQEFSYQHEDATFLALFLLFVFAAQAFGAFGRLRLLGLFLSPLMLFTLLATQRRAGIIVLLVGVLLIGFVMLLVRARAFLRGALPVIAATCIFVALSWGSTGVLGQPARAIQSLYEPDLRDAASNLYRDIETFDISQNIQTNPLLGVGFGREFEMVIRLPDLSWWPFWHFETHNSVLWIWLKTGAIGYVLVWSVLGGAMTRAAAAARRLDDAELRALSLFCLVSLVGTLVYAYVDLGFVSERLMVALGILLGVLEVVESLGYGVSPATAGGREEPWPSTTSSARPSPAAA